MCDYSLQQVASRPAAVDDKLRVTSFGTGTQGFASIDDETVAVCVLPGTELVFDEPVRSLVEKSWWRNKPVPLGREAIFRQINLDRVDMHHDCLEFPTGRTALLTYLAVGQTARVVQLPAKPKTAAEAKAQERIAFVG